jgi:thiamine-phosphate pyrophosphorylase
VGRFDSPVYLITDRHQTGDRPLVDVVDQALAAGVGAVQLREKDLGGAELLELARLMRMKTHQHGALLLINDRIDIAMAADADGVHLGKAGIPIAVARRLLGPTPLIGYSTHSLGEAVRAESDGADFVTFGPVFDTPSKAAYGSPVGIAALAEAVERLSIPVYALGGIKAETIPAAMTARPAGIALISAIIAAPDPKIAALDLLQKIKAHVSNP